MHAATVDWFAFAAAIVARVAIGMAWYSPRAFGQAFAALTGRSAEEIQAGLPRAILTDIVGAAAMAFVLAQAVSYADAHTWVLGVLVGLLAWLGFVVVTQAALVMHEKRSMALFLINTAQWGVVLAAMGAIFAAWR